MRIFCEVEQFRLEAEACSNKSVLLVLCDRTACYQYGCHNTEQEESVINDKMVKERFC